MALISINSASTTCSSLCTAVNPIAGDSKRFPMIKCLISMQRVLGLMVMAAALSAQPPAHPAQPKPKPKSSASATARTGTTRTGAKPAASETAGAKSTTKSAAAKTRSTASRRLVNGRWVTAARRPAAPPKPVGQQRPEADRYQEIQKALQERGYFKGEPNGEWADDSADALKRFQADQKLSNDGKINSLTLIGLGLGPKHDGGPIPPPPAASLPAATLPPVSPETVSAPGRPQL
jgi:hypothetical protein